ncbi:Glucose/arabinose dehydrogenase, beta-propeller fold [Fictibacillus solisalsi]|uniref:Glucose/arabinose dehydrogenase, beta-propeller fold n=1 Tax=Fictibacillus solisalsi TaxID=459525 RepID=A0A1G9XHI8_9BACL|nr:PQQ-dependent sugar dehydrogenase [Fictibacillus solisalsi]SDM96177.1 Glucose/arabinose dehydrogenase, beta-propeller fold [Fictibacillus solisalsi]
MYRFCLLLLLILTACSSEKTGKNEKQLQEKTKIFAENLNVPWQIDFYNGETYISERTGIMTKVTKQGKKVPVPLSLSKKVFSEGEGGFLGFVFDPKARENHRAYAYYTYKEKGKVYNRITSLKAGKKSLIEDHVLLEGIPGGSIHNGGRIKFGPDGKLYATTGDSGDDSLAQKKDSLAGKILRMNADGSIPKDNPFEHSYVYSYGHRNPQGLAWDGDKMFSSEHGSANYDEINVIKAGRNYGWPVIKGDESKGNMEKPLLHSGRETWAPSGIAIQGGEIYIACLRGEKIIRVNISGKQMETIASNHGRLRDVQVHNRTLYFLTNNKDGRGTPKQNDDKMLEMSSF